MKKIILKNVKKILILLLPPIVKKIYTKMYPRSWYFKGQYKSWQEAEKYATGYGEKVILESVLKSTVKVKNGDAIFERDSVIFDEIQYSWPLLSGLLWSVASNKGKLNVLDFGGALGTSYFQNRKFLNKLEEIKWNVIEQKHYVQAGKKFIQDDILNFYYNIEECCEENEINVAIFSGVLDIIANPYDILDQVINKKIQTIIIDRSAFINSEEDFGEDKYVLQVIPPSIYKAILPFRHISYIKMKKKLENSNYDIVENFASIGGVGKGWEFRGLIAKKNRKFNN